MKNENKRRILAGVIAVQLVLQAAVFRPCQAELQAPSRMYGGEEAAAEGIVKHLPEPQVFPVGCSEAVAVREVEHLAVDFRGQAYLAVHYHSALFLKVIVHPEVVVAGEEVHLHAVVREFGDFSQQSGVAFGDDVAIFVPEVEDVSEQVYGGGFVLDAVEEVHKSALLRAPMRYGKAPEVCVGDEVYRFHFLLCSNRL